MGIAVPDAVVADDEGLTDRLDLPDPDDRHVLATVIAARAIRVTFNLADFPRAAIPREVSVVASDDFVVSLIEADLDAVATVVDHKRLRSATRPSPRPSLLDGLAVVGLHTSVHALRTAAQ